MSDDVRDQFGIPKDMRSMAEASFEQARKTFEKFVTTAQATAAGAGGAGQRNKPDRRQGRHGRGEAESLTCRHWRETNAGSPAGTRIPG